MMNVDLLQNLHYALYTIWNQKKPLSSEKVKSVHCYAGQVVSLVEAEPASPDSKNCNVNSVASGETLMRF